MIFPIPFNRLRHAIGQCIMWVIPQFVHGWFYVTAPVALAYDVIFIFVQRRGLACIFSQVFTKIGNEAQ